MSHWSQTSGNLIADRRFSYAEALFAQGDFIAAADLFAQIVEIEPHWPPARFGLAKAAFEAGDRDAARAALQAVLLLDPRDQLGAAVLLARIAGEISPSAMPDAFVAALFDDYASRFDNHLVEALEYRAPQLLMEALSITRSPLHFSNGIDLGCGTGLMGKALSGACDQLIGVDLSAAMIERARLTRQYQRLVCADILSFLGNEPANLADLVMAADVFCYVPDLKPVFAHVERVLVAGGLFAFTVQTQDGAGARIGEDSRVHHAVSLIAKLLHETNFDIASQELVSSRKDRDVPVAGAVFVAIRQGRRD